MTEPAFPPTGYQIVCICGGYGYPLGNASAARITTVGKALRQGGIDFALLHCGPSPDENNTRSSGVHEGIRFDYTTSVRRPENPLIRFLVYTRGLVVLAARLARLRPHRQRTLVYLYVGDGTMNFCAGWICRLLGLSLVQELCEWPIGDENCSAITRWLYKKQIFKMATGALVISKTIEQRVIERRAEINPRLLILRVPSIVDAERFVRAPSGENDPGLPHFVYCGTWLKDVYFLIRTFALVKASGYHCKLRIVGPWPEAQLSDIIRYRAAQNLAEDDIVFTGCVDERTLEIYYKTAIALLMPLWDDDRSRTRLPNKLGEYLASGRPVVASKVGDLTDFLFDNVNACLAAPGDERDFADRMISVLRDPVRAKEIGLAGQQACLAHLDYRAYSRILSKFFVACTGQASSNAIGPVLRSKIRNALCGLLALAVIASGRARRARKKILAGEMITPLYFHNPNKRLFARCIRWLTEHGYTFISTEDLIRILHHGEPIPKGAVWISFDDGYKEWLDDLLPIIRERRVPVTMFFPSGIIESAGILPWLRTRKSFANARDAVTVSELQTIATCPEVTVGGHTVNHSVTAGLPEAKVRFELGQCRGTLESWVGSAVTCFSYPEGRFDGRERGALAEFGYRLAATTTGDFIMRKTDPYLIPRFCIGDNISFPEAVCNMVGVWRPLLDPLIHFLHRWKE
jgi:glycosyltransferase involved in cell wall biosynthesis/peptidoglycan/xylan/chitin deacetylase (PgdA/CDA1 family)